MDFDFFEISLAIVAVIVTWTQVKRQISYMVGKSQDNQGVVNLNASESLASSSEPRRWKYDVFLSFRGTDTRKGIANEICNRLSRSGIKTFMDEHGLQVGDVISPALINAIKESRFAIIILSKDYASSAWCLEELREICLSREDNKILPLFFEVDPTDVRYQKRSFEEAFSKHDTSGRHESEKVEQWRAALEKVANISGWNTNDFKTHSELVDKIVESLRSKVPLDPIESTGDFQEYEETKEAMRKVMEALTDEKITAVGVHGMGGVGKTSMVRHVAAQACRNGTFNHWIMVVVSQHLDLKIVQGTLADKLCFKFEEETEDGRADRLHKEIMGKEKLLIILDDVWDEIEWSKIGIPGYKELQTCNSKVLVTTRKMNVCHAMKCTAEHSQVSIPLNILSPKDALALFRRNAGIFESTTFEEVAKRVAAECKGLPIALITVAKALGDKDLKEWKKAALRLEQSQYVNPNHEEAEVNAFKCIRLSYDYLKNEDHKFCFLLCCMFPEDHEIEIENFFRYTIGKRLFRDAETMEEARGRVVTVVKYLKNSGLLLDSGKKGCVKMHDVIRDTAIQIAESEDGPLFFVKAGCGLKGWPPRKGCTAISLMWNKIRKLPEEELVCPNLQILLLNGNKELSEIPEKLIQNLKELKVLDLSNTNISVLPQSFSLLTNLQALYLDDCDELIDISVVRKLNKLKILSMRDCPGGKLSREIGHLTNLRILDVNRSRVKFRMRGGMVTIPSKVISKLQKLEELYMVYCGFEEDGRCVAEGPTERTNIIRFDELAGLSNLKILQVGLSESFIPKNVEAAPDWDYFYISIIGRCTSSIYGSAAYKQGDHNSRSLFLNGATISTLPDWFIKAVTEKTEKLEYDSCGGMSDIVMEYDHGRLHKLKHLTVAGYVPYPYEYLKELMNTTRRVKTGPVFENLEELHLISLIHLEELCVGELPPGSLSNLKVLHMNDCFILKCVSEFVQRLPNLEKLDLNSLYKLEYVFRCEGFEPEQSKLREIHLLNLKALRNICNGPAPHAMFQSLKILTIYSCELLQSLFASDVAQCLVQLEDLLVEDCPLLERVMEAVNKEKTVLPKLKNLVLKNLPMLYGAIAAVDIECPSLEHFIVVDCPKLLFSTSSDLFKAFKSRNQFSFSASISDPVQLYLTLRNRTHSELVDNIVESFRSKVPLGPIESTEDFPAFRETEEATNKVMKALTDDKITAVGVHGMAGVGKTSMMRHVAEQACINGTFNGWIMAVVSPDLDLKKIQGTFADKLHFKFEEETEDGRADRLHKEIMGKEKLLIILDDVWDKVKLSKIGIPDYKELQTCNSKVLLTTRRLSVCNAMECHEKIHLVVLSHEDSWIFFVRNAGKISFEPTSFEKVAKRVAFGCKGLPIALIAVARALRDEDQEEWEKAAERLEQSQYANPNHEEYAFQCIRLSYDYLKDGDSKSCFLLCCLFPEDHDIKIEDLFRYAIGKRLFQDAETMEVARGRLVTVVKYLKNSGLLLDSGKKGCVKMHAVIRATALNIAQSEDGHRFFVIAGRGLKGWPRGGLYEGCTAISIMWNKIRKLPEEELVCPNLQILLLNRNAELSEIPEKLIQNLKELRVLDLSNTNISVLPQSFSLLTNLQALYLDNCGKLIDISVVGKLHKLEILSMRDCPRGQLSREIEHLTNLRILDVNRSWATSGMVKIPSKVISKSHKLEELYMVYCS